MKARLIPLLGAVALLIGCASTRLATADQDRAAKAFSVKENHSSIYIARKNERFGQQTEFKLKVDNVDYGELAPGTYQLIRVGPGTHKVEVKAALQAAAIVLNAIPNKNYFYSVGAKEGESIVRPEINLVLLESMGKLMISQSKRAEVVED